MFTSVGILISMVSSSQFNISCVVLLCCAPFVNVVGKPIKFLCVMFVLSGPFWICTTLVFATAISGNISNFLVHRGKPNFKYTPEFQKGRYLLCADLHEMQEGNIHFTLCLLILCIFQ